MRPNLILPLLAVAATACGPGPDAVWLLLFDQGAITANDFACDTNFLDASCPQAEDGEPSPWTLTATGSQSPAAGFAQIIDGPGGRKMLVIEDAVFVGEKERGVWRFTWDAFEQGSERVEHERGYFFERSNAETRTVTIALDVKGGEATGTIFIETTRDRRVAESDGWLPEDTGFGRGSIGDESPIRLDGSMDNFNDLSECASSSCFVETSTRTVTEVPVTAYRTGEGGDAFDGLSGAGQGSGT
jgi:hypothetical protein